MATAVGRDDGEADHSTVFIDTSLDTRLVMIVSDSEIVSDFKKKIVFEHRKLFPAIGDVNIECLKVKQRGNFYHLIDSMPVKSAFDSTKRHWFVSADASRLDQNDGIQHMACDQLALPWVTRSRSIEQHDNHGSPSTHSKIAPFVNQKVLNADKLTSGDSCKDVLKNVEEDKSCNDKQLDHELPEKLYSVNTDISSKKRTRDVHNESSLQNANESEPSVKKKRKTQSVKGDAKALEENTALTYENDKVNDHKSKGKDLIAENNRNKGEKCSDVDQVAIVVPSIEGVGSENVDDVAMIVENNSHQEMSTAISQQFVQKPVMENEIDSSLMNDQIDKCKYDSEFSLTQRPELKLPERKKGTMVIENIGEEGKRRKSKKLLKHSDNLTGDISSTVSASVIDERKTNEVSEKTLVDAKKGGDVIMNEAEVSVEKLDEISRKAITDANDFVTVTNDENLLSRSESLMTNDAEKQNEKTDDTMKKKNKKKSKKSAKRIEDVSISKHVNQDICGNDKEGESSLFDADKKGDMLSTVFDSVIDERNMNEVEKSLENMEEKLVEDLKDINDVATVTNEETLLSHSESLMNNDAEVATEKMEDTMKKKKKKKTKKSTRRNEDESIAKHANPDISGNFNEDECSYPDVNRKDGDMPLTVLDSVIDESKINADSEKTLIDADKGDDVIVNEVDISVKNMEEISSKEVTDTNDVATVRNEENILHNSESLSTENNLSQVNAQGILDNLETQNEKTDDTTKKKKRRKTEKSGRKKEDKSITKHVNGDNCENDGDTSLTVFNSVNDVKQLDEVSGKTLVDDDVIVNKVDVSVENMQEKLKDTNNVATVINEENNSGSLMNNDADKQNEKMDDTMKKKKKKKSKKSAGMNEDKLVSKNVNDDICENVKENFNRKDDDMGSLMVLASVIDEKQMNEISGKTLITADKVADAIVNEVDISVEGKSKKEFKDTNDVATVTNEENILPHSDSLMNNDADILTVVKNLSQENAQLENQNEKMVDTMKKNKKRKTRKSAEIIDDESTTKHLNREISENVNKSQDLPIKHQSTQVELESKKSQSVDHHHLSEKHVNASEVSKVNDEVNYKDHFAPDQKLKKNASVDNRKDTKKMKVDQSEKLVSKKVNNKVSNNVLKDPNITNNEIKTRQRTNKQQSNVGQTEVKSVKKNSLNSSQFVKRSLKAPGTIFGDDSDDNSTTDSNSNTRTPSGKLSSSSSSSDDDNCAFSIVTRRNSSHARIGKEGAGKNNLSSERGKLNHLLRSASSFKKAKSTASSQVEDTDSQTVDFVPDSQPVGK